MVGFVEHPFEKVGKMAFPAATKRKIFDNAHGKCERCGRRLVFENHNEGERGAWEAHHRTAVSNGGTDAPSNGEALCLEYHKKTRTYGTH